MARPPSEKVSEARRADQDGRFRVLAKEGEARNGERAGDHPCGERIFSIGATIFGQPDIPLPAAAAIPREGRSLS